MAFYTGTHEDVRNHGRGPPRHIKSGYPVNDDEKGYGGRAISMEYPPQGGGMEPRRQRYNTYQGAGARQNTIHEEIDNCSHSMKHSDSATGFLGPEPIIHSLSQFDDFIYKKQNGNGYSDDAPRESTGTKEHSALLRVLKPVRFEMPNHPSYHGELTSKEAEGRLTMVTTRGNCYLTRYSKTRESYILSAIVFHDGIREPVHMKMNIDTEQGSYSLEGTEKLFRTLDELLSYFENNALSSDIRNIGSICPHPDHYKESCTSTNSPTTGMTTEHPDAARSARSPSHDSSSDSKHHSVLLDMQKNFLDELSKQREEHKKEVEQQKEEHKRELEEERRIFKEEIEKERQMLKEQMEEKQRKPDNDRPEPAATHVQESPQNNADEKKKPAATHVQEPPQNNADEKKKPAAVQVQEPPQNNADEKKKNNEGGCIIL